MLIQNNMKYRIVQRIERQSEDFNNFKFSPTTAYKYIPQYRYDFFPIWFDISFPKDTKENAQKFIDAMISERKLPKTIIHEIQSE